MRKTLLFIGLLLSMAVLAQPKREFRGAWIQCVNGQFKGIGTATMQRTLTHQLDELQKDGCNVIIFQVRPECDALYESQLEPWSYYLTGQQGKAPQPYWDPLAWMIEQSHKRGMELHAWINPYRAKTKSPHSNAANHVVSQHPERCFQYDGLTLLNPALKENRDYICDVVRDILQRYDVDGLHIDDYFYPYPVAGCTIPDDADYRANSYGIADRGDWRRHNVNLFMEQLCQTIRATKPWVKFGVSPFGIYRNKKSDPNGSNTNGLQNYDQLYADVLLWANKGWVDYCVPQLYWEIGNKAADYDELIHWWSKHCQNTTLVIGEDVERTAKFNQQARKMFLHAELPNVKGTVLWYAKAVVDNVGNYGTQLRSLYWRYPALQPVMQHIDHKAPKKPRKVKVLDVEGKKVLFWTAPKGSGWKDEATSYAVYRFEQNERVSVDDPSKMVAITRDTHYELSSAEDGNSYIYAVTALDRMQNESSYKKVKVRY
ncbi:MAG: family 10 glycosylhydrolase [Prevotella sp.]|nr:family 10 glycosylhydrolase [Prevotella sp.]